MTSKIIGLAVLLVIGYWFFRPRHKADGPVDHGGHEHGGKDVSPHTGHGGHGGGKPRGGCCG